MKSASSVLMILFSAVLLCACAENPARAGGSVTFDHSAWDQIVQTYVDENGKVAYRDLAAKDLPKLERYLQQIAEANPAAMSEKEALAFTFNAYNALAVKAVLEGSTAESLIARAKFFKFKTFTVGGKRVTLDELEQKIIRPTFKDPRVHFALVCASASCPKLVRRAYTAENIDAMLDERGREFLADRSRNPLGTGPAVTVSSIFKWYAEDFAAAAGSVQVFIARYAGHYAPPCLMSNTCKLEYAEYDWTLNAQPGQRP